MGAWLGERYRAELATLAEPLGSGATEGIVDLPRPPAWPTVVSTLIRLEMSCRFDADTDAVDDGAVAAVLRALVGALAVTPTAVG